MSVTQHKHYADLRQLRGDPTRTRPLRRRFANDMAARVDRLNALITETVVDNDALRRERLGSDDGSPKASLPVGRRRMIRSFTQWFLETVREVLSEPASLKAIRNGEHWTAPYLRDGYLRGWKAGTIRLKQRGVQTGTDRSVSAILQLPRPRRQLRAIYERGATNLGAVEPDIVRRVREGLTEGLARGWNPRKIARELRDDVGHVDFDEQSAAAGARLETIARTEIIHSYTQATIDRYERAGVESVTGRSEWATADDDRVCPICEHLEGDVFSLRRIKTGTFRFHPSESEPDHLAGEYPLRPPVHPSCRCALLPVVDL